MIIQQEEGTLTGEPWGAVDAIYIGSKGNIDNILPFPEFADEFLKDKTQGELEELILKSAMYLGTFEQFLSDDGITRADLEQEASQENMTYVEFLKNALKTGIGEKPWLKVEYLVYIKGGQDKTVEELRDLFANKNGIESFEELLETNGMTMEDWQNGIKEESGYRTEKDALKYTVYAQN